MSALGQKHTCAARKLMSALPPRATSNATWRNVRFGPKADIRCLPGRSDVLIYAEQVCRIVAFLDLGQAVVALSISGANAIHTFIHHEIYVSTSRGIRVHCNPIVFRPPGDSFLVRRVRVDTDDDSGPVSVAVRLSGY